MVCVHLDIVLPQGRNVHYINKMNVVVMEHVSITSVETLSVLLNVLSLIHIALPYVIVMMDTVVDIAVLLVPIEYNDKVLEFRCVITSQMQQPKRMDRIA